MDVKQLISEEKQPMPESENKMASAAVLALSGEDMIYRITQDNSLITNRKYVRNFPQTNLSGPSQTITFVFNSGAAYILPKNCYLTFRVKTAAGQTGKINSACDFINRIAIFSRTNEELERINDVNLWANQYNRAMYPPDFFITTGSVSGYAKDKGATNQSEVDATGTQFVIPLSLISGFFNYDKLVPNHLCSGMRIEISFETTKSALQSASALADYTVDNMSIMTDNYKLNEIAYKLLNLESAQNGLEVQYKTWFHQKAATPSVTVNVECRKAVSRALCAMAITRNFDKSAEQAANSFISEPGHTYTELQWRCGSLFYPNQKLIQPIEMFTHSLMALGKLVGKFTPGDVTVENWIGKSGSTTTLENGGLAAHWIDLERSTKVDLSAIPLNSSRVLAFNLTCSAQSDNRVTDVFLQHIKLARCFLNNTTIEE